MPKTQTICLTKLYWTILGGLSIWYMNRKMLLQNFWKECIHVSSTEWSRFTPNQINISIAFYMLLMSASKIITVNWMNLQYMYFNRMDKKSETDIDSSEVILTCWFDCLPRLRLKVIMFSFLHRLIFQDLDESLLSTVFCLPVYSFWQWISQ